MLAALMMLSLTARAEDAPKPAEDPAPKKDTGIVKQSDDAAPGKDGWTPLFNGKDLTGWVQRGGKAKYRVVDGAIVGTTVPNTANTFLCTKKDYADFTLEVEFKVDPRMNSGVQIRSQVFDEEKTIEHEGKKIVIAPGRVHGYQVEIDPSPRMFTGGIYDEGRRGWLAPLDKNPDAQKALRQGEWNHFRVECQGDSIKTWLNGVPAADLKDDMTRSGFIALQVHAIKDNAEPMEVAWRNIRIKEAGSKQ